MIYAYFGGKSPLFDASFEHVVSAMAEAVPPRPDDLPAWAAELVEFHDRDPRALRISMWAQLERPQATTEPLDVYAQKVSAMHLPEQGELRPADVLMLIYAIAQAWQLSPAGLVAHGASSTAERAAAARAAVHRLTGSGARQAAT
ncbi:hypothetical protein MKD51_15955 [Agrococcus sp. ARC_14]|nr:hypothetical protein [Agrococcus sp. ARC_14]